MSATPKHNKILWIPAKEKRKLKRLQKREDEITKLANSLANKVQRLINAKISIIASRHYPNFHESTAEWVGRNLGWIEPSVWKALQSSGAMEAAAQYRHDWIIRNGPTPKPRKPEKKKSIWAHVKKNPPVLGRVKLIKLKKHRNKMDSSEKDGSIWTCSGGLPTLGKRK